jgi:hypothetical protein
MSSVATVERWDIFFCVPGSSWTVQLKRHSIDCIIIIIEPPDASHLMHFNSFWYLGNDPTSTEPYAFQSPPLCCGGVPLFALDLMLEACACLAGLWTWPMPTWEWLT